MSNTAREPLLIAEYALHRTSGPPITFKGEMIACVSTKTYQRFGEKNHWWNLTLFQANDGKYVIDVEYKTIWKHELEDDFDCNQALVCNTADELADSLWALPAYKMIGDSAWEHAVTEILKHLAGTTSA